MELEQTIFSKKKIHALLGLYCCMIAITFILSMMVEIKQSTTIGPKLSASEEVTLGEGEQLRERLIEYFRKNGYPMAKV